MKIKNIINLAFGLILSLASLSVLLPGVAHAVTPTATLYWLGSGSDQKFTTATNWNTVADGSGTSRIPANADVLYFQASATNRAPINDQTTVTLDSVVFTGTTTTCSGSNTAWFTVTGTALKVTNTIENNMTGSCKKAIVDTDVTTSGSGAITITPTAGIDFGSTTNAHTFTFGSQTVNVVGSDSTQDFNMYDKLVGSGNLSSNLYARLYGDNSGFTGIYTQSGATNLITTNEYPLLSKIVIADAAGLNLQICDGTTATSDITLNGGVSSGAKLNLYMITCPAPTDGGQGGSGEGIQYDEFHSGDYAYTTGAITLDGKITLGADQVFATYAKTSTIKSVLSGAFKITPRTELANAYVLASTDNQSTTVNGTYKADPKKQTISDDSTASIYIDGYIIVTLDGKRGDTGVGFGGVLSGTGTVGKLRIDLDGTLAPGHSPGCISSGDYTQKGLYQVQLGGADPCAGYDQVKVAGTVTLDAASATLDVSNFNDFKPTKNQKFIIISNDGADAVSGTFKDLAEGVVFASNGNAYKISYKGGDGNDVVVTFLNVGAPNTGFSLTMQNPLVVGFVTTLSAGALLVAARKRRFAR